MVQLPTGDEKLEIIIRELKDIDNKDAQKLWVFYVCHMGSNKNRKSKSKSSFSAQATEDIIMQAEYVANNED